jgi:hypothetical protein
MCRGLPHHLHPFDLPVQSELPEIKAIVVMDTEGNRVAAKFYGKEDFPDKLSQTEFERKLFKKIRTSFPRTDPEIHLLDGLTLVLKGSQDVCFCVVGGSDENELILTSVVEALVEAVGTLIRAPIEKRSLFHNLELLLLSMDELVDGGVILEMDPTAIIGRVMLRGAVPDSISSYKEMTMGQVLDKARDRVAKQFA